MTAPASRPPRRASGADHLRRPRMRAGEGRQDPQLEPERPIPSEAQIEQEFGVARATARHAVAGLRDDGLVVTVPGTGTRVRKR